MTQINLHSIFRHLVQDDKFLSIVIRNKPAAIEKRKKTKKFDLMANMVTEYAPLERGEIQPYNLFPSNIKNFLTSGFIRLGIENKVKRDLTNINISFLNSLNMILRPELHGLSVEEQLRNLTLLEQYIIHRIEINPLIDKIKKTTKVKKFNQGLINDLRAGKVTHDLIQMVANIFDINLLVFDLTTGDTLLYWACGRIYPHFNLFRKIYCMAFVRGNYEPIMLAESHTGSHHTLRNRIYTNILLRSDSIKCQQPIILAPYSLSYINTWKISKAAYFRIIAKFFPCRDFDLDHELSSVPGF